MRQDDRSFPFFPFFLFLLFSLFPGGCGEGGGGPTGTPPRVSCSEPVSTPAGQLEGVEDTEETCAYLGIPYALPPVGDDRFRPPRPALPRSGVFSARSYGPVCAQIVSFQNQFLLPPAGSEECLTLNIFRPRDRSHEPYTVLFFIHGGAFTLGSGSWPQYRGSYLAQKGAVVVTINYRLGPFGFLALKELKEEDPRGGYGNYGILDQLLALRWVHDNIGALGGDPARITIFGESAGGMSVCTLLSIPEARAYLYGAIIESGGCTAVGLEERSFAQGVSFAERLGCGQSGPERLACLRRLKVDELLLKGRPDVLADGLQPHLDGVFLQEIPLEVLRQGRANGVALMAGAMADEVLPAFLVNPSTLEYRFLPWERFWERLTELFGAERVSALKALYPQEGYSDPLSLWEDIIGDVMLRCPTEIALRAQSQGEPRTFHYHFTWNLTFGRPDLLGAFHGYDLAFVFGVFESWDGIFGDALSRAMELREAVQRYWVRFAEKGDPNGPPDPPWLPYREGKTQLLGESILSVENPLRGRCAYWEPYLPTGIDQLTQGIWDLGGR